MVTKTWLKRLFSGKTFSCLIHTQFAPPSLPGRGRGGGRRRPPRGTDGAERRKAVPREKRREVVTSNCFSEIFGELIVGGAPPRIQYVYNVVQNSYVVNPKSFRDIR